VETQSTVAARYVLTAEVGHVFVPLVRRLAREHEVRSICDLGGGANPVLALDDIEQLGLRYLVVDGSGEELAKAPGGSRRAGSTSATRRSTSRASASTSS